MVWPNMFRGLFIIGLVATWLNWAPAVVIEEQGMQEGNPWFGLGGILFIGLLLIYYFRNKAVVFLAVKQLQVKSKIDKKKIYSDTEPHVGSLIKFGMTSASILGMITVFLLTPVLYLSSSGYDVRAWILGALAISAYMPILALIYCVMVFGPMFMTIHTLSSWDGVRASSDVFRGNWLFLVGLWLILLGVELVWLVISVGLTLLAMLPFVLLTQIFYDVGGSAGASVLQALGGIAGFVVFFMSQAMIAAYQRVAWTVAFFEIVRPVKMDEAEEPETIPEVIS